MKRLIKVILVLLLTATALLGISCKRLPKEVTPVSIGIPTEDERFGINRSPWDMMFYDGKLYVCKQVYGHRRQAYNSRYRPHGGLEHGKLLCA